MQHIDLVVPPRWVLLRVPEEMHRAQLHVRVIKIIFAKLYQAVKGNLNPQAVEHARHTKKGTRRAADLSIQIRT